MKTVLKLVFAVMVLSSIPALAVAQTDHVAVGAGDLTWGPAPAILPAGAQIAVVQGDPGSQGDFVLRLKMPDGYKIMPHWHPADENVTVISGTLHVAMGDTFDPSAGKALGPAGYTSLPAQMNHFAWAEGATEVQIHGKGPFVVNYVNPADDPSGAAAASGD